MNLPSNFERKLKRFFSERPIKRAFLFGSYARNDTNKDSDVDILVELDYDQHIGMKFFAFQPDLEKILNKKVHVVSDYGISKHVRPFIERDKILIYERTD